MVLEEPQHSKFYPKCNNNFWIKKFQFTLVYSLINDGNQNFDKDVTQQLLTVFD